MSIEDNEHATDVTDATVHGLLGTAFAESEPPLRDLASGSIARGDAARHRNRMAAAGGATLSVVAVLGTFALVAGAGPAKHGPPNPASPATSPSTSASPTRPLGFGPVPGGVDKNLDIKERLPALLQPLLPSGITAGKVPPTELPDEGLATGLLTGPTGTNQVQMWVGTAPADDTAVRQATCSDGTCTSRSVDGRDRLFRRPQHHGDGLRARGRLPGGLRQGGHGQDHRVQNTVDGLRPDGPLQVRVQHH